MKSKKRLSSYFFMPIVLILLGIICFCFTNAGDTAKLNDTLDETISFVKSRINRYEIYNANDRVKSLVRLLDKSEELSRVLDAEHVFTAQDMDNYAKQQRLTGVLVLDEKLNVSIQTTQDYDAMSLWKKLIDSKYVRDILESPSKTYMTRLRNEGNIYDFAAVARQDTPGVLIAYAKKEEVNEKNGDLTMETVFADFPFKMDGSVVISDGTKVVSTNESKLLGMSVKECNELYQNTFRESKDHIVRLDAAGSSWYGRKEKIRNYDIYVFFPAMQVFMTRNIVCLSYVLIAIVIFTLFRTIRIHMEQESIMREQKRLQIINALGHAYSFILLIDIKKNTLEVIKSADVVGLNYRKKDLSNELQRKYIDSMIAPSFQKSYLAFTDISTMESRLKEHDSLSCVSRTIEGTWIRSMIVPQKCDEKGNLSTVLLAISDVTEEKEHELEQDRILRNALSSAEHANRAKTAFLNNMSHDIRTPMNAIIGFTSLAAEHLDDREIIRDYLEKISTSGKHLLSLINDVLDMSRIESGSVKIENNKVHLPDILEDLKTIILEGVHAKQQKLLIKMQDVVHEDIITDKLRLTQVLLNIISNAVKFTSVGGTIHILVEEKASQKAGYAVYSFCIKDNGIGMSKEFQEHVFDSFARERTVTESGITGTGLGMAITKNIVDLMGGTIHLTSKQGEGSEFIVTLECELANMAVQDKQSSYPKEEKKHLDYSGKKVLLVEDNELNREIATEILKSLGLNVDCAADGMEAVEIMSSEAGNQYDMIFMDIQMPKMDGYTATREIRTLKDTKKANVPIIAMTANAFDEDRKKAIKAGMNGHIAKPIDVNVILQNLDRIFGKNGDEDTRAKEQ